MHVLITGAAGFIGRHLTRALEASYELRLGDVQRIDDPRWISLDVTRPDQARRAVADVDAVVHLAIAAGHEGEHEDDEFNQARFDVNVRGTFNLLRAAADAGVRRFVHTSSIMVTWGYEPPQIIAGDALPRPVGTYARTKHLAEALCEQSAREDGLSVLCLRIAKPVDAEYLARRSGPLRPQWIAISDLMRAYDLALSAENIGFEIVTVVGESSRRRWDLSRAEQILGYRPQVRLEDAGYELGDEREPY
jgi:nucleoside-diphosphate-sugar epimerase